mgnify:CR=1 FL=1
MQEPDIDPQKARPYWGVYEEMSLGPAGELSLAEEWQQVFGDNSLLAQWFQRYRYTKSTGTHFLVVVTLTQLASKPSGHSSRDLSFGLGVFIAIALLADEK